MSRPSFLVRLLRRRHREPEYSIPASPRPAVSAGERRTNWLVIGNRLARAGHLAHALAESGEKVSPCSLMRRGTPSKTFFFVPSIFHMWRSYTNWKRA